MDTHFNIKTLLISTSLLPNHRIMFRTVDWYCITASLASSFFHIQSNIFKLNPHIFSRIHDFLTVNSALVGPLPMGPFRIHGPFSWGAFRANSLLISWALVNFQNLYRDAKSKNLHTSINQYYDHCMFLFILVT